MKLHKRSGFTMVELLVVFMIMSILYGAGVPSIQAYYQRSGFQDVQNRAETVFYAAQHTVTSMTSSAQMDLFIKKVQNFALPIDSVLFPYLGISDDSTQRTRYYAIRFKKSEMDAPSLEGQMVLDLLDNLLNEANLFNASIAIEIDLYTNTIQTVFYSLADSEFDYGSGSGILLTNRDPEVLQQKQLGMAEADLSVKVLSLGTEISQEPFRVPEIVGDVSWTNPETNVGWWEDDHLNLSGTAWVVTDPTITPTNPIPVQLTLAGKTLIKSFRINWWSPINGPVITYQFGSLFETGSELPLPTRVVMNASEFMSHYWYIAIAASAFFVFLFQAFMRLPQVAYEMDEFKIRFKPIRRLMRTIYTARFARTLSSLYSSGMPVLLCLQVGKTTVGNRFISAQFEDVIIAVRRGGTLADAVGKIDGFVQKLTSTIFVGEETGNLEHMLNVISASLDYESEISLSKMTTMVEPIMLIIMAVIIGFVMLAVMMPIFQMYGSIQ